MVKKILNHSFGRYLIVGGLAVAVDYGSLLLLFRVAGVPLAVATTVAFLIGLVVSFILTKFWTFGGNGTKHTVKQSVRQGVLVALLVCFNLLVTNIVVGWLNHLSIGPEISKLLTTVMVTFWNYILYKKLIFKAPVPAA